ncbi:unnamed protein product [Brachionus calyciflorus]|uniref:Uncharacterized protein n=1 Tax=Brachionus calyciflorus TaxID=104777 RepID=A0A813QQG2_9BILA|nr:unnamed protein product [Brachionus calyciflorus]
MEELKTFFIQEKFNEDIFSFQNIPQIIYMKNSEVFVNKNSEKTEPQQYSDDYERDYRLKSFGYGDWQLSINLIKCEYFQNRWNVLQQNLSDNYINKNLDKIQDELFYLKLKLKLINSILRDQDLCWCTLIGENWTAKIGGDRLDSRLGK